MADDRKARYRDISDGLLRQRRNLLLISLLMPLFFLSGATIDQINVLGTVIAIKNPSIVEYSIILLFGYFLLRYWQYYKEETYVNDMYRLIRQYLYNLEIVYLNNKVLEKTMFLNSDFVRVYFSNPRYGWVGRLVGIPENQDRVFFPFMRECEFYIYPADENQGHKREDIVRFHEQLAEPGNNDWHPVRTSDQISEPPRFYRSFLRCNIFSFHFMRLVGACKYMLSESYFTDYQLPFIVAVVSAVLTTCTKFI